MYYDVKLTGMVTSKTTKLPIKGIKVTINDEIFNYGVTDETGKFEFYANVPQWNDGYQDSDKLKVSFWDNDGIENGQFADTTFIINPKRYDEVRINMEMREIQ
jgi:hypothetical protein